MVGLAEAPDPEELILNCYRLAERFHQSPDAFLSMPISDIGRHVHYAIKLTELRERANAPIDDD